MAASEMGIVIQSLLSVIVLSLVIFWLWPEQRIDLFRQQMFALRDELFDFAADGKVAFHDPAYSLLRDLMNGFIRYAHNLTPFRTWMSYLSWRYLGQGSPNMWSEQWSKALDGVENHEVRAQLEQFHSRATMLVVSQLVLSPGLLAVSVPIIGAIVILHWQWSTLRTIYNNLRSAVPPMTFLEQEAANAKP